MLTRRAVREPVVEAETEASGSAIEREAAFRRLVEGHLEHSYQLANAILGDPSESRDVVHDAFIRAWQCWPSLRDQAKFEWWFKRIVVNTCRNRLRDTARRRTSDLDSQASLAAPEHSGRTHDRIMVEQALAGLKPDDRVVLALRYYHDLKLSDIAEVLGVPTGTVKSRLNSAHTRLRTAVQHQAGEGSR